MPASELGTGKEWQTIDVQGYVKFDVTYKTAGKRRFRQQPPAREGTAHKQQSYLAQFNTAILLIPQLGIHAFSLRRSI